MTDNTNMNNVRRSIPAWAERLLAEGDETMEAEDGIRMPSEEFRQKCAKAADVAHKIFLLRKAKERLGFKPIPLWDYVKQIEEDADVSASPFLKWLGIEEGQDRKVSAWRNYARLAEELRFNIKEALVALRVSFASKLGFEHLFPSGQPRPNGNGFDEFDKVLSGVESGYDEQDHAQLKEMLRETRCVYEEAWPED